MELTLRDKAGKLKAKFYDSDACQLLGLVQNNQSFNRRTAKYKTGSGDIFKSTDDLKISIGKNIDLFLSFGDYFHI